LQEIRKLGAFFIFGASAHDVLHIRAISDIQNKQSLISNNVKNAKTVAISNIIPII